MDPISAVSIAAAAASFLDLAGVVVTKGLRHHNSATDPHICDDLEIATKELDRVCATILIEDGVPSRRFTAGDVALRDLAKPCRELADDLVSELNGLRAVQSADEDVKRLTALVSAFREGLRKSDRDRDSIHQHSGENHSQPEVPATANVAILGEDTAQHLLELANHSERCTREKRILDSLRFAGMEARREQIVDAHRRTCDWILDEGQRPVSCPDPKFLNWLETKTGFYWISGKAGSGKSTLIKFLSHSPKVRQALSSWAGSEEIVITSHFFWNAGIEMQKTKGGLFQTLLFEIFRQYPSLIREAAADRWTSNDTLSPDRIAWTTSELAAAFEGLTSRDIALPRMLIFIDGMDDFCGGPEELIKILTSFARCRHIKMCLSSRPWNQFEAFFGKNIDQSLRLQDFNTADISHYVAEALEENEDFRKLRVSEPRCDNLGRQIAKDAKDVFLWATLVVRSILEGLSNADPFHILEERLRLFPENIGQMYRIMLASIEPVYYHSMVRTFEIMQFVTSTQSIITPSIPAVPDFAFLDETDPNLVENMTVA
ncbi:MAG: hypothetical protein Q9188_003218 [Gyalolechia gomerana]